MSFLTTEQFTEQAERSRRAIENYIVSKFRVSPAEAEDVAAEAIFRCLLQQEKPGGGFRGEATLKSYLIRTAHNVQLTNLRKKKNARLEELDAGDPDILSHASLPAHQYTDFMAGELDATVEDAMGKLTPAQRDVIENSSKGLSTMEIAAVMGSTEGSVKSHKHRAMQVLRQECAPFLAAQKSASHAL